MRVKPGKLSPGCRSHSLHGPGKRLSYTIIDPDAPYPDIPQNYTTLTYDLAEDSNQTIVSVSDGDFSVVADGKKRYENTV